jgi:DNA polymerase-3 subunit beta
VVSRVASAASDDESRQALTGVLLEVKDGKATLVAADGYRLACHALPLVIVGEGDTRLIIPPRTLRELVRVVDGEVEIHQIQEGNQVSFTPLTGAPTLVLSRLIDGAFPDYSRIIPTEHFTRAAVSPQYFLRAINSVIPFAKEASNYITITFREGELHLNTNATEVGSGEATVPAEVSGVVAEGEHCIALNGLFVKDALEGLKNEAEVWIEMREPSNPLAITIPSPNGGASEYTHVIMPMTLR